MRRELNEIEYLNWCVGQPYNMVVAVPILLASEADTSSTAIRDEADRAVRLLREAAGAEG